MRELAALVVFSEPAFEVFLRTIERGDAALLREARRVARAVRLNRVDGLGNRLRRGEKAEPPARHAPRLRKSVDDNRVLVMRRREARHALVLGAVVKQLLVNLVTHDEHAFLHADVAERFDFRGRVNRARRITRRIENEQSRVRRDGGVQLLRRHFEFRLVTGLNDHRRCTRELHHLRVAQPIRRGDDHLIALFARREDDVVAGMFAAARHDHLRRFVSQSVLALELVGNGLPQFRNPAAWRVFGEAVA